MKIASYRTVSYLTREDGGNGLLIPRGFDDRLRIAPLVSGDLGDAILSDEIAFLSMDDDQVRSGNGLENFIETTIHGVPAAIFDNHNHAIFFWYQARARDQIQDGATLVHIDMHSDLWENQNVLSREYARDLEKVWEFTNYSCNVGNYIKPAIQEGLIGEIVRIEGEQDLIRESNRIIPKNSILNLDLDFFANELDDVDFELKKRVILHFASQVSYITIATSPFFIPGASAIAAMKRVFS